MILTATAQKTWLWRTAGNSLSILLGNGNGSFGAANNITVGSDPYSVAVGKFNNDSFPDLAVANISSNSISILLGNGSGGFTNTEIPLVYPIFVTVADLNGDSKQDLAVVNNNKVSTLLGNGDGTFTKTAELDAGLQPTAVIAKDLNGDGLPDLATTDFNPNNVSVLLNTPNTVNFGTATYSGTEGTTDTVVNIPVTISGGTPFSDVVVPIVIDPSSSATENSDYTFSLPRLHSPQVQQVPHSPRMLQLLSNPTISLKTPKPQFSTLAQLSVALQVQPLKQH
jgi:hypothetical protein